MAAAAYKVTMVAALGSPSGPRKIFSLTASDVNAANWLFANGIGPNTLNGKADVYIVDCILSAAGTDTSQSEFYINGVSTGFKLQNATSLATTIVRQFQNAPLLVPAGATLNVIQVT